MLKRYLLAFAVLLLVAGCGETPTEPEPDGPDRDPQPEVVQPRQSFAVPADSVVLVRS